MTPLRAALRIARRDAWRHKWRSLLVVVLILVPVAAATGVDVLARTTDSIQSKQEREFGAADAIVGLGGAVPDRAVRPDYTAIRDQLAAALPPGSRSVRCRTTRPAGPSSHPGTSPSRR